MSDLEIVYGLGFGDVYYETYKKFDTEEFMPTKMNTFAITVPNNRGLLYLKIWDPKKAKGHQEKLSEIAK